MSEKDLDPYCYPGTSVLRNLAGIRQQVALNAFEGQSVAHRLALLSTEPITMPFSAARLLETHRRLFGGVYEWAGDVRSSTGIMYKQRDAGYTVTYADSAFIPEQLARVAKALAGESFLRDLPAERFADRAAYFYSEFDAIHPFREGNSRTLRQFFADIAKHAGHKLQWERLNSTQEGRTALYTARDIAVLNTDYRPLANLIIKTLAPLQQTEQRSQSMSKERLLVMNGVRFHQAQEDREWKTLRTLPAGNLKPGTYNLYLAKPPDPKQTHEGLIVHTDHDCVIQKIGSDYVRHPAAGFDKVPEVGTTHSIRYDEKGIAMTAASTSVKQGRSL